MVGRKNENGAVAAAAPGQPFSEAIDKLKSTDPPLFLSPNSDLSSFARLASQHLFASLKPYSPKSPFDQLHSDGFDAEQIWQQIDLQSQPLINTLKREIKRYEEKPEQILKLFGVSGANGVLEKDIKENVELGLEGESEESEGSSDEDEDDDSEEDEEDDEEEDDDNDEEKEEEDFEDDGDGVPEVEDEFLKIKDLEKYLVREEEKEYGSEKKESKKNKKEKKGKNVDDEEDESEESEEDDADELLMYGGDGGSEDGSEDNIRYEDFYVPDKKRPVKKQKQVDKSDDSEMEEENADASDDLQMKDNDVGDADDSEMEDDDDDDEQNKGNLSTYEKEREKIQAKIKQMEAENLAPKDWTMQGEISASKRPVDSALEVDLDFEHNIRPPPVITEEVTASLEEIIKKRILEGHFDDVQRAPKVPSAAPKETKELDDNKSKKGLAEIYEEEYAQQTGFVAAPLSFNDELKKEASNLFKRLCLKLDALSHFHFAPKPVIEDMSIQTNVPALAMEEIAPVAVSDAAMLAPEEVFSGKKDIKEANELTKEDRKKRRAKKKRKYKAVNAKKVAERAPEKPSEALTEGKE